MDQFRILLERLTLRQKITLGGTAIAVLAALSFFVRWNEQRDYRPLFTGLSAEDAGKITSRLRENATKFKLNETGDTVLVPSERVAETRLELAAEGLPKSGRMGYELFDKVNLATTDFQERVNFHRAIEGELERSITSLREVESARVHVTFAKESVFMESRQPAKASVVLKLAGNAQLDAQNVAAISHLAASAVEGLEPQAVSILDTQGRLLSRPRKRGRPGDPEPDDAQLEFRGKLERELLAKIDSTLEPLLGPEHFRVGVSTEVDFSSGEQSEESFDPSRSVMASQQRTEDVSGSTGASGVPGTPSSLPRPTSKPGENGKNVARRSENITYQSTRTVKRLLIPQGSLKRVSLSVLIDHDLRWEGAGEKAKRILEPPSAEKLKKISDLVSAAAGLQTQRGDQIMVESMPFEATLNARPPVDGNAPTDAPAAGGGFVWPAWMPAPLRNPLVFAGIAGVIVLGALVALVLRFFRRKKVAKTAAPTAIAGPPEGVSAESRSLEDTLADHEKKKLEMEAAAMKALKLPGPGANKGDVLQKQVMESAKKDPAGIAQVIRTWLQDDAVAK